MNTFTKYAITTAALTFAVTANNVGSASGRPRPAMAERVTSPHPAWAIVRVSVSARGDVEGMRITYRSGEEPFNKSVLQAVSKTNFTPISETATASTFDYLLTADGHGKRSTRIMAPLPGDPQVSAVPSVAVRAANPWTSGNALACAR
jgi:TonB family protein